MEDVDAMFFAQVLTALICILMGDFLIYKANYYMLRQIYKLDGIKCEEKMIAILLWLLVVPLLNLVMLFSLGTIYLYTYSVKKAGEIYKENID